jgi:hypothetical protein
LTSIFSCPQYVEGQISTALSVVLGIEAIREWFGWNRKRAAGGRREEKRYM